VTSASEPRHSIFLQPLPDTESLPLRRWIGRESWRREPVISLAYEPDGDRILFRLIDTPSTASGVVDVVHAAKFDGELFIGFDGTDSYAWPTTIAVLDFGRHCDQGTSLLLVACELVGGRTWTAALSLRAVAESECEIRLSEQEAAELIGRWTELVVGPIFEAADAALAAWLTEEASSAPTGPADQVAAGSAGSEQQSAQTQADYAALASAMALMPRLEDSGWGSADEGGLAKRHFQEPTATGVTAAMARRSMTAPEEPPGPMPYGIRARLADIWSAWRDGHAVVPPIPAPGASPVPTVVNHGITPYMEVRNRHFLDWAERERRRMHTELTDVYQQRAEIRAKAAGAERKAEALQRIAANLPAEPLDLLRRNVVEQNAPEALIRARRQREFELKRAEALAPFHQAAEMVTTLQEQAAGLDARITARQEILYTQIRQLHQHALLRCGIYMQHIVHYHPEGSAVIPYLKLALPELPEWVPVVPAEGAGANGHAGPRLNGHAVPAAIEPAGPPPDEFDEPDEPDEPQANGYTGPPPGEPDESQANGDSGTEH
jgi:hypothetical protein